jgi:iron complex transport system ATP-binding protein
LIARSLMRPPALLLLDEPTAGLDLVGREMLLAGIDAIMSRSSPRPTILFISHHLEELPAATDRAVLMRAGTIAREGMAEEVFTEAALGDAFGVRLRVSRTDGRWAARLTGSADAGGFA